MYSHNIPKTASHFTIKAIVRYSHPFQDIFDRDVFETFFAILQNAKVDFGRVNCGWHGVFSFRELNDPSKD
jgi:hypothetical protein